MFLSSIARSCLWPRFFALLFSAFAFWPASTHAECPPGSDFRTCDQYNQDVPVSQTDLAVNAGHYSLTMDLALPVADAGINISSRGFTPIVTIPLNRWQWRLRVLLPTEITVSDLSVSYRVTGSDGTPGMLTSVLDGSSKINATVINREIRQRDSDSRRKFLGFIDLQLDYTSATRFGHYTGTITVTVDCL